MKLNKVILVIGLLIGSSAFAEEQTADAPKMGLWERFCLNDKIGDACDRAVNSLNEQISQADEEQADILNQRMQAVTQKGCDLKVNGLCERLERSTLEPQEESVETMEVEVLSSVDAEIHPINDSISEDAP